MKHSKITLSVDDIVKKDNVFIMECPICGIIHASSTEFDLMPQFNVCEGKEDKNEN
ncbi:MAG: hypothetical protein MUE81_22605 [Thermoflexibacter sp.]|jgi:hypothetical protein|nr:hypothetical protein [Thermoflexibacter sp.]